MFKYNITVRHLSLPLLLILAISWSGCVLKKKIEPILPDRNVIVVNNKGFAVNPNNPKKNPINWQEDTAGHSINYYTQLDSIISGIHNYHWNNAAHRKIMIFIHGGLDTYGTSTKEAYECLRLNDLHDEYYPVFINWNSGLTNGYGNHLTRVRDGEAIYTPTRFFTAITLLATDLLTGIAYCPTYVFSPLEKSRSFYRDDRKKVKRIVDSSAGKINFIGNTSFGKKKRRFIYIVSSILGNGTIFLIKGLGTPTWDNLSGRTKLTIRPENEFRSKYSNPYTLNLGTNDKNGAVGLLMKKLSAYISSDTAFEITLIGHSMGSMISDQIIQNFGDSLPIKKIVYMAGAGKISDWGNSVLKYLEKHQDVQFYNLCLNPDREINETHFTPLATPGSLLCWIDNYFETPQTFLDRTIGQFANFAQALPIIPEANRRQINLKVFDYKGNGYCIPIEHGDFSKYKFWKEAFWSTTVRPERISCGRKCKNFCGNQYEHKYIKKEIKRGQKLPWNRI